MIKFDKYVDELIGALKSYDCFGDTSIIRAYPYKIKDTKLSKVVFICRYSILRHSLYRTKIKQKFFTSLFYCQKNLPQSSEGTGAGISSSPAECR